jgi:hypothetical protein
MLTTQQQQALDELMAHSPLLKGEGSHQMRGVRSLFGTSNQDLQNKLMALLGRKDGLQAQFLDWCERNPMDSAFSFLAAASMAFYLSERGANPKIKTYVDAYYYISTCASVGYADVFAVTQLGKAIASLVMVLGPAMATKVLDKSQAQPRQKQPTGSL